MLDVTLFHARSRDYIATVSTGRIGLRKDWQWNHAAGSVVGNQTGALSERLGETHRHAWLITDTDAPTAEAIVDSEHLAATTGGHVEQR